MRYKVLFAFMLVALLAIPAAAQSDVRFELPTEATPIAVGETVAGTIGGDVQAVAFSFEGTEDQAVGAYILSEATDSLYLYLFGPEGELLVFERISFINLNYKAYIPLFILEEDGTYQFVVTSSDNAIFGEAEVEAEFTLTVTEPEYTVLALGDSITDTLDASEEELAAERVTYLVDLYVVDVRRTEIPHITFAASRSLSLTVEPLGEPEAEELKPNRASDNIAYLSPMYAMQREYLVLSVSATRMNDGEEYTLSVLNYEPLAIADGETVSAPISIETLRNYLRFEGAEGDEVTITLSASEATRPAIALFDPAGRVAGFDNTGAGLKDVELLEDGDYTIMVYPQALVMIEASQLGEVEITLAID